jgi:hypothetical protein
MDLFSNIQSRISKRPRQKSLGSQAELEKSKARNNCPMTVGSEEEKQFRQYV